MKILIVDETETIATLLKEHLAAQRAETTGSLYMEVVAEPNYGRAVEVLKHGSRFDVVVVEPLPFDQAEELGLEVIRNAKQSGAVPIALTAGWRIDRCVQYMREEAWDVLTKARPMTEVVASVVDSMRKGLERRTAVDKDAEWVSQRLHSLCRRFPGQWIAVNAANNIFLNAETRAELIEAMREAPPVEMKVWRLPLAWTDNEPDF